MSFLIIGTILAIFGSASCAWGDHIENQVFFILGLVLVAAGITFACVGVFKNYKAKVKKKNEKVNTIRLALTALLLALGAALSMVKVFEMPLGGSITLCSMLPVTLISIEYGLGWGLSSAFIYSIVQFGLSFGAVFGWGLSPAAVVGCILIDYILAYTSLGFAGLFRKKGTVGICIGIFIALLFRYIFHIISGTIIFDIWMPEEWSSPLLYSICYNGAYMLPEFIITMVVAVLLFKAPQFNKLVESNLE